MATSGYDLESIQDARLGAIVAAIGGRYIGHSVFTASICADKAETKRLLQEAGIPVVAGHICYSVESLHARVAQMAGRCYVKPVFGASGEHHMVLRPEDHIDMSSLRLPCLVEPLMQGREASVDVVAAHGGQVIYPPVYKGWLSDRPVHPRSKLRSCPYPWTNEESERLSRMAAEVARAMDNRGVLNIDLVLDLDGSVFVFEVNARFSGSTRVASAATGVNQYALLATNLADSSHHSGRLRARAQVFEFPVSSAPEVCPPSVQLFMTSSVRPWAATAILVAADLTRQQLAETLDMLGASEHTSEIDDILAHRC